MAPFVPNKLHLCEKKLPSHVMSYAYSAMSVCVLGGWLYCIVDKIVQHLLYNYVVSSVI